MPEDSPSTGPGELFSPDDLERMTNEPDPRNPVFTAAHFKQYNRLVFDQVCELLAAGGTVRGIAAFLRVSPQTVSAVRRNFSENVEEARGRLGKSMMEAAALATEGVIHDLATNPDKIPAAQKAVIAGIMTDKAQLMNGGPTHRVEVTREAVEASELDPDAWADGLEHVEEANAAPSPAGGAVVMGSDEKERRPKGAADRLGAGPESTGGRA